MNNQTVNRILELNQKHLLGKGKLFKTEQSYYLYDTGTSKVARIAKEIYLILEEMFNNNNISVELEEIVNKVDEDTLKEFLNVIEEENLLDAIDCECLATAKYVEIAEKEVNQNLNQIILELTESCNLRCGYCIYNEHYDGNRQFGEKTMKQEVAKRAIDYLNVHGGDEVAVTFYGGEPLINYKLMKWCIDYADKVINNKKLSYSFTTNLTLLTDDIANYLKNVENLHVVCSLDGPENVHDSYRRKIDGRGSFNDAIRGLKYLIEAFGDDAVKKIAINLVFAPPYTYEKLDTIESFFTGLEWLPSGIPIDVTYTSEGSVDDKDHLKELGEKKEYLTHSNGVNPLLLRGTDRFMNSGNESFMAANVTPMLLDIHKRIIMNQPYEVYPFNACCYPGARRLYISTEGNFYICERIGTSPDIGNVFDGVNINNIRKYYLFDYSNRMSEKCNLCWAKRMCKICYAKCFDDSGLTPKETIIEGLCNQMRNYVESELVLYHNILESSPEKLDYLNKIVIV